MTVQNKASRLPTTIEVISLMVAFAVTMLLFLNTFNLPIQLALFSSWFLVIGLGIRIGLKYDNMQRGLISGINNGMEAILVLLAIGALIGTWIAGGIVPSIIYYGLSLMNPNIFLFAAFIICALTSLATGTSFGTIGTTGIAMMGIGNSFGIPMPLVAGAVISGAYVGDKMSPLSDTTVMTASLCKVDLVDHIKSMMFVSAPAAIGASLIFLLVGFFYIDGNADTSRAEMAMFALKNNFDINGFMLLPLLATTVLLAMRKPAVPVIIFGALLGIVYAVIFQDMSALEATRVSYFGNSMQSDIDFIDTLLNRGGIESMYSIIALIIFALGLGGLMERIGMLQVICDSFLTWANNSGRLTLSTLMSGLFGNLFGGAAYVSLITACTITEKNYDQQGIDRRVLSRNVEAGGTITTPMVPWSDGGVFMAATLGVTTMSYLPFLWYHFLVLLISIFFGYANIAIWRTKKSNLDVKETQHG